MKKKIYLILSVTFIMLYSLWNNLSFQNDISSLTLANVEALAKEETKDDPCKGLPKSGYGKYYSLHESSCVLSIQGGITGGSIKRGVKNKCKLEKPCNENANCTSNMEKACH